MTAANLICLSIFRAYGSSSTVGPLGGVGPPPAASRWRSQATASGERTERVSGLARRSRRPDPLRFADAQSGVALPGAATEMPDGGMRQLPGPGGREARSRGQAAAVRKAFALSQFSASGRLFPRPPPGPRRMRRATVSTGARVAPAPIPLGDLLGAGEIEDRPAPRGARDRRHRCARGGARSRSGGRRSRPCPPLGRLRERPRRGPACGRGRALVAGGEVGQRLVLDAPTGAAGRRAKERRAEKDPCRVRREPRAARGSSRTAARKRSSAAQRSRKRFTCARSRKSSSERESRAAPAAANGSPGRGGKAAAVAAPMRQPGAY